jgi:hypothetical protein
LKYILKKEGVMGTLPLGCFPLWEREGGTLTTITEDFLNNLYIEDFYRAQIFRFPKSKYPSPSIFIKIKQEADKKM